MKKCCVKQKPGVSGWLEAFSWRAQPCIQTTQTSVHIIY